MLARARVHLAQGQPEEAADALERALEELDDRDGGDPRAEDVLTPAELRVARLAVTGNKNREIATTLVVSVKAVEYHLANVYRKLGVKGREELGNAFGWALAVLTSTTALG
jgi:DNA-binding NarL/FixJ family response regulator